MDSTTLSQPPPRPKTIEEEEEEEEEAKAIYDGYRQLVTTTMQTNRKLGTLPLYKHPKHNWSSPFMGRIVGTLVAEHYFKARPSDVFVASFPKSGTTWTMALLFTTINRTSPFKPFTNFSPHDAIPNLENEVYFSDKIPDLSDKPSPRLFGTHIPYPSLPPSIVESKCKLVYVWRDPKDVVVSFYYFRTKHLEHFGYKGPPIPFQDMFDLFCDGCIVGSHWDHVLDYWKASVNNQNILFMKYEDMKKDVRTHLKKLGEFVGKPFSEEEEKQGVVEDIIKTCSFNSLKKMEVNVTGSTCNGNSNDSFYRKGEVGDWANHISDQMKEKIDQITTQKFSGSGLLPEI